jgi:hypothetical protein
MAANTSNGDSSEQENITNKFFCTVSSDLEPSRDVNFPYNPSTKFNVDHFIIEPYQVERKLAAVNRTDLSHGLSDGQEAHVNVT